MLLFLSKSIGSEWATRILVSSAKITGAEVLFIILGKSFIYSRQRLRLRFLSCFNGALLLNFNRWSTVSNSHGSLAILWQPTHCTHNFAHLAYCTGCGEKTCVQNDVVQTTQVRGWLYRPMSFKTLSLIHSFMHSFIIHSSSHSFVHMIILSVKTLTQDMAFQIHIHIKFICIQLIAYLISFCWLPVGFIEHATLQHMNPKHNRQ